MPSINYAFKEITCKIVYYGPGAGGKTTNLHHVHGNIPDTFRGELVSLATEQDRTLFFDYLPLDIGDVKGFKTKFQLYTVPGQVYYNATRKLVLRGVDGIVFVADSGASRYQDSIDSFNNLIENLRDYGLELDDMPFVIQYNKRDLPDAVPLEKLRAALNPEGKWVEFEAVATDGTGVRETLREISSQCLKKLQSQANIISDEQIVQERLGVAGGPGGRPASLADRNAPELNVSQLSGFRWRGMGVGSGEVTISSNRNERGEVEYSLTSKHKILGMGRALNRTLRYVGEDRREDEGVERTYYVLRDASSGREKAPIAVFVEKMTNPKIYLMYPGFLGEVRVGPKGEAIPL